MARIPLPKINEGLKQIKGAIGRIFAGATAEEIDDIAETRAGWDNADVSLTLANLIRETQTKASGRVQVITLADFRGAIGPLWDQYRDRILLIVESTIGRMIGRGNIYIPQDGDEAWLLLFPACREDEAAERAGAIAAKIGDKLIGARFTETEPPLPEAARLDLNGVMNGDGSLNMGAIRNAVTKARDSQRRTAIPAKPQPQPSVAEEDQRQARRVARMAARSLASELKIKFCPAWSADTQSVDSVFFRAFAPNGANVYGTLTPNDATAMDLVEMALRGFAGLCASGARIKFTLPVPFALIDGPDFPALQRMIAAIKQEERLLKLRVEVTHIPADARAEKLVRTRELLRGYVRDMTFLTELLLPNEQILALDHIVIGADLASTSASAGIDALRNALHLFRHQAGRRQAYALGLQTRSQLAAALQAGFDEVGGHVLSADLDRPPERAIVVRREEMLRS